MNNVEVIVELNGLTMKSIKDVHRELARQAELPFYGENLDALNDALTGMVSRPLMIRWIHADESYKRFPEEMMAFEKLVEHVIEEEKSMNSTWPEIRYERLGGSL